mmetsp:Transcript_18463/g.52764  ORF Transcript_18463/g.52764 Transcript_18463/m.52764 type:complete len:439 (-) Transcript_18463:1042-2358(-)
MIFLSMRPGRTSAGSSCSGWLVVMISMRPGVSTTPSSTFSNPAKDSASLFLRPNPRLGPISADVPFSLLLLLPPQPPAEERKSISAAASISLIPAATSDSAPPEPSCSTRISSLPLPFALYLVYDTLRDRPPRCDCALLLMREMGPSLASPSSSSTNLPSISVPASTSALMALACADTNWSTVEFLRIMVSAASMASSLSLASVASSLPSPTSPSPGKDIRRCAMDRMTSGFCASLRNRSDFSMSSSTSSRQSESLLSSSMRHMLLGSGMLMVSVCTTSAVFCPSRRFTTFEAASTSSITKMTSLKFNRTATSQSSTRYFLSKKMDMSSALVETLESGTLMMDRPVWCASALMRLVLPVPGGPCSITPSLCGYPAMEYLPVRSVKWPMRLSSDSFSWKKRLSKVFWLLSLYRLYTAPSSLPSLPLSDRLIFGVDTFSS